MTRLIKISTTIFICFYFQTSAQTHTYSSDNGFSGTFELTENNKVKKGSIVIKKFKTSVGVFFGKELEAQDVIFPVNCTDCFFAVQEKVDQDNYKVHDLTGTAFERIIESVKKYVQIQQENKKYRALLKAIQNVQGVVEQKRLVYNAYYSFYNKERIENLLDSLTATGRLQNRLDSSKPTEPVRTIVAQNSSKKSRSSSVQAISNKMENTDEFSIDLKPDPKFVSEKDQRKIEKLESKKAIALRNNDFVLVNEIEESIARIGKKSKNDISKIDKGEVLVAYSPERNMTTETMTLETNQNRSTIRREEEFKEKVTTATIKERKEKDNIVVMPNVENNLNSGKTDTDILVADLGFKLSTEHSNCEKNIGRMEKTMVRFINDGYYDVADAMRNIIKEERQNCKQLKKESRKPDIVNTQKRYSRLTNQIRRIDSPRIFF